MLVAGGCVRVGVLDGNGVLMMRPNGVGDSVSEGVIVMEGV